MRALVAALCLGALVAPALVGCASVPVAPPPLPPMSPREVGAVGGFVYDSQGDLGAIDGAQGWALLRLLPNLDVGGAVQLTNEGFVPRFVGGSLSAQLRLHLNEEIFVGAALQLEYADAFWYLRSAREPVLMLTFSTPVVVELMPDVQVWLRPALGGAASARWYARSDGVTPAFGRVLPVFRLSFGAAYDLGFVQIYGETTTTLPFGGAYLGFGLAVPI